MSERLVTLPALNATELQVLLEALKPMRDAAKKLGYEHLPHVEERLAVVDSLRTAIAEALSEAER